MFKINARQIKMFDEINADKKAIEQVLNIQTNFAANQLNQINKTEKGLWEEIAETFDLDLHKKQYKVSRSDGFVVINEVEEEPHH